MAVEIIMPKAGVAMECGTIVKWLVEEGDTIATGDAILEITTDKVNMEVEAEEDGVLIKKLYGSDTEVPVFTVIGYIGEAGETVDAPSVVKDEKKELAEKVTEMKKVSNADNGFDIIVLGGGPGGYVAAIKAAMLGASVAIVEEDTMGGTCLNRGCIPTKTYMKNVELMENIKKAGGRGIKVKSEIEQDIEVIVEYKNSVVKSLTDGVTGLLKSHGVTIFSATGQVKEDCTVSLSTGSSIKGDKIILATGSKVRRLPIEGIDSERVVDSTYALDMIDVPKKIVVVGGGVIGCEFAEIFSSRGSHVHIIELSDHLLPMMDIDVSLALEETFEKKGINYTTNNRVIKFDTNSDGISTILDSGESIESDYVLFAVGREANLNGLDLLNIDQTNGFIKVNEYMETSIDNIYAIGDLTGDSMLAHSASKMGEIAAENACGEHLKVDLKSVPSCIYTIPEAASVGMTENQAKQAGKYDIGKFAFSGNGRALASGYTQGFIKVIAGEYGEILGVHMFGQGVAEMINIASNLIALEIPVDEAADLIFAHPCLSEGLKEAMADSFASCIHLPKSNKKINFQTGGRQ